jgi:hypothetical protein
MSYDIVQESVPSFIRRLGDWVAQGSNNSLLWLGTDRAKSGPASIDDGLGDMNSSVQGKGTGAGQMVVGRSDSKGNPDLSADKAYLYLSMQSMVDTNLGLTGVEQGDDNKPSAVLKSDAVRVVYRSTIKISADDGSNYIYIDKSSMTLNTTGQMKLKSSGVQTGAATDATVLGSTYRLAQNTFDQQLLAAITTFTTAVPLNAVPIVGGALAAPGFLAFASQVVAALSAFDSPAFSGPADPYLSKVNNSD